MEGYDYWKEDYQWHGSLHGRVGAYLGARHQSRSYGGSSAGVEAESSRPTSAVLERVAVCKGYQRRRGRCEKGSASATKGEILRLVHYAGVNDVGAALSELMAAILGD